MTPKLQACTFRKPQLFSSNLAHKVTSGVQSDSAGTVPEDRPSIVLGGGNNQQAYYVSYLYTAQADQLDINAVVAAAGGPGSGSAHMYALSNQVLPIPEPSSLALAALGMLGVLRRRRA